MSTVHFWWFTGYGLNFNTHLLTLACIIHLLMIEFDGCHHANLQKLKYFQTNKINWDKEKEKWNGNKNDKLKSTQPKKERKKKPIEEKKMVLTHINLNCLGRELFMKIKTASVSAIAFCYWLSLCVCLFTFFLRWHLKHQYILDSDYMFYSWNGCLCYRKRLGSAQWTRLVDTEIKMSAVKIVWKGVTYWNAILL